MSRNERMPVIPEIADGSRWYCVLVKPQWMTRVECELYALGYRVFTPKLRKWVSHARKRSAVYRPVLSRYLFVDIDYPRQDFGQVRGVRGVVAIISNLGAPLPFNGQDVMEFLFRQMKGEWDEIAKGKIPVGAKVRIMDGPHAEELAVVTRAKGNKIDYKLDGTAVSRTDYAMNVRAA